MLIGAISVQAFLMVFYFVVAIERVLLTRAASDGKWSEDTPVELRSSVSSDAGG
ncbi:MAG TPA: hypothetical protein VK860_03130 [Ilumatobacteraceae bacterium]|nr:hypothetical protein [Ilumatobacteraceae bacterium]